MKSSPPPAKRRSPQGKRKKGKDDEIEYASVSEDGELERLSLEELLLLEKATISIQALFRGHMLRQLLAKQRNKRSGGIVARKIATYQRSDERMADLLEIHFPKPKLKWTQCTRFNVGIGVFVASNAVQLGLEAEWGESHPTVFKVFEWVFGIVFLLELGCHLLVEGPRVYFSDKMNWLDFVLVVMSVVDVILGAIIGSSANLKLLTLFRMLRLTRLARLMRLFKMFKQLHMIVSGFIASIRTLFWASTFLSIVVYGAAIWVRMMIGGADNCAEVAPHDPTCDFRMAPYYEFNPEVGDQDILFGAMERCMLTLTLCFTEGCNMDVMRPIVLRTPWLLSFWIVFLFFTTYGVLNLIIGLFLDNALKTAASTERELLKSRESGRREILNQMRDAFMEMDSDRSGTISKEEFFASMTSNDQVRKCFLDLGLDREENLFDTLDADRTGSITFDDFFEGALLIMKGQESAKAKDMVCTNLLCQAISRNTDKVAAEFRECNPGQKIVKIELGKAKKSADRILSEMHKLSAALRVTEDKSARVQYKIQRCGIGTGKSF